MKHPGTPRQMRLAEDMKRRLSQLLREEVDHEGAWQISVKAVEVARDLSRANVWVDFLGEPSDELLEALAESAGPLRRRLGKVMHIRRAPELIFKHDDSAERGVRISALIDEAVAEDRRRRAAGSDDGSRED